MSPAPIELILGSNIDPQGEWAAGVSYARNAVVAYGDASYLCRVPHLSVVAPPDDVLGSAAKWQVHSGRGLPGGPGQKGDDGLTLLQYPFSLSGFLTEGIALEAWTLTHDGPLKFCNGTLAQSAQGQNAIVAFYLNGDPLMTTANRLIFPSANGPGRKTIKRLDFTSTLALGAKAGDILQMAVEQIGSGGESAVQSADSDTGAPVAGNRSIANVSGAAVNDIDELYVYSNAKDAVLTLGGDWTPRWPGGVAHSDGVSRAWKFWRRVTADSAAQTLGVPSGGTRIGRRLIRGAITTGSPYDGDAATAAPSSSKTVGIGSRTPAGSGRRLAVAIVAASGTGQQTWPNDYASWPLTSRFGFGSRQLTSVQPTAGFTVGLENQVSTVTESELIIAQPVANNPGGFLTAAVVQQVAV